MSLNQPGVPLPKYGATLMGDGSPPKDRGQLAYLIFVLLGIGGMFPWNAFLTAYGYFSNMFCDFPFPFIMSIAFNVATVSMQFAGVAIGERVPLTVRVLLTFGPFFVSMVLLPFTVYFFSGTTARLIFTLGLVFFCGFSTAMGFNCIIGLASQFPPEYVGAVMTGQGIAGVLAGGLGMVTKAAFANEPDHGNSAHAILTSTLIYFLCAAFIELCCIMAYFVLVRTDFSRFHMAKAGKSDTLLGGSGGGSDVSSSPSDDADADPLLRPAGEPSVRRVLRKVALMAFTVWSVFFVTLSLFPGMTTLIPDFGNDWFPIVNIFLFQVFDFVGRMLPRWVRVIPPRALWVASLSRVVFGALFLLCILPLDGPKIFNSPYAGFVIMALFALSNGYVGTLAMMYAPDQVNDREKATAGRIMSVALQLGIFSAVLFALAILYFVSKCQLPGFLLVGKDAAYCAAQNTTNATCVNLSPTSGPIFF